jgi:hypothetical protein
MPRSIRSRRQTRKAQTSGLLAVSCIAWLGLCCRTGGGRKVRPERPLRPDLVQMLQQASPECVSEVASCFDCGTGERSELAQLTRRGTRQSAQVACEANEHRVEARRFVVDGASVRRIIRRENRA